MKDIGKKKKTEKVVYASKKEVMRILQENLEKDKELLGKLAKM